LEGYWEVKERGFSLIELVVVLVLLSLSVALIAPSLSRFSKSVELKAAAKKVAAILRYCRSEAINKGKVYQVILDPNLMEVKVQPIEAESSGEETEKKEGNEETEKKEVKNVPKAYLLPAGVQLKEFNIESTQYPVDLPAIEFYPNGGSNGGDFLLDTQSQKGFKIKVHFLTGTVAIEKV
jgi:type II secretion system protein H